MPFKSFNPTQLFFFITKIIINRGGLTVVYQPKNLIFEAC